MSKKEVDFFWRAGFLEPIRAFQIALIGLSRPSKSHL